MWFQSISNCEWDLHWTYIGTGLDLNWSCLRVWNIILRSQIILFVENITAIGIIMSSLSPVLVIMFPTEFSFGNYYFFFVQLKKKEKPETTIKLFLVLN